MRGVLRVGGDGGKVDVDQRARGQRRAQRVTQRVIPEGRLHIGQRVLDGGVLLAHAHDAGETEKVAEHGYHARREQIVDDVHVRRHARHQPADGIAVVVLQVDLLQISQDPRVGDIFFAQLVEHGLVV